MSFDSLLEDLVATVYDSRGAIFLDNDGEVVQLHVVHKSLKELDLIGAYHGITLSSCRKFADEIDMGDIDIMLCRYKNTTCLVKTLHAGYFVLLALGPQGNIGQAIYKLKDVAEKLNIEMGI